VCPSTLFCGGPGGPPNPLGPAFAVDLTTVIDSKDQRAFVGPRVYHSVVSSSLAKQSSEVARQCFASVSLRQQSSFDPSENANGSPRIKPAQVSVNGGLVLNPCGLFEQSASSVLLRI
jgi:hypothetical protein